MRARLFFGISVFLLLGSFLALVLTLRDLGRSSNLISHCYEEIKAADSTLSMMKDSGAVRGEFVTGRSHHLAPFITTLPQIHGQLAELRTLAAGNSEKRDVSQIEALASAMLAEIGTAREQTQSGQRGAAAGMVTTNAGGKTMDRLRVAIHRFDQKEQTLVNKRARSLESAERRALIIAYTSAFAVACTALVVALLFLRRGRRTEKVLVGALENVAEGRSVLTEREQQLTAALAHEKVIVRELHHRVKNNLQVITSFLQIRGRAHGGEIGRELADIAGRLRALCVVQTHIYGTDSFDRVDFAGTLSEIAERIVADYGGDNVTLIRDLDGPLDLNVDRAVPLGLVCYEMMLNAMKYAWPDERRGTLRVNLLTKSAPRTIEIRDDGVGFVPDKTGQGLGTLLLRSLSAEAGAEASIETFPGVGTTVTVQLR